MIKRIIFIFLVLFSSVFSVLLQDSKPANAWTSTSLEPCNFAISPRAIMDGMMAIHPYFFNDGDITDYSYVLYQTPSQLDTDIYTFTVGVGVDSNNSTNTVMTESGNSFFLIHGVNSPGNSSWGAKNILEFQYDSINLAPLPDTVATNLSSSSAVSSVACLSYASANLTYDSSYTHDQNLKLVDPDQDPNEPQGCDPLDIPCIFIEGVSDLFMPSDGKMQEFFDNLNTFFNNKLGFLLSPFDFFADLFNAMFSPSLPNPCQGMGTQTIGGIAFGTGGGTFFGAPVSIDFCGMPTVMPTLWNVIKIFFTAMVVFGLMLGFNKKLRGVLQK